MKALLTRVTLLALCLLPLSCNSGGGGGGLAITGGGITGSGRSSGIITGFGSIFVNGIEWETDVASITVDEQAATENDLALGMRVVVVGDLDASGTGGAALSVVFDEDLKGPIVSIAVNADGDAADLEILGQVVRIDRTLTVFENTAFDSLAVDDVIEVSGFPDDQGRLRATRVELEGTLTIGSTEVELEGVVSGFDGVSSFQIGSITVNFDPAGTMTELDDLPSGVQDGVRLEVEGTLTAQNTIFADEIEPADEIDDSDASFASLEGVIDNFNSLSDFEVNGVAVDASGATLNPLTPTSYFDGAFVEAKGSFMGGVLIATSLERRGNEVEIHAEVRANSDVDATGGSLVLVGIPIITTSGTLFDDERDDLDSFDLSNVVAGDFVEVRGYVDSSGNVVALRIDREDNDDVILQGPVQGVDPVSQSFTILGVLIPVNSNTEFEDENDSPIGLSDFFNQVQSGDLLKVKDDSDGDDTRIDIADEVEFEIED